MMYVSGPDEDPKNALKANLGAFLSARAQSVKGFIEYGLSFDNSVLYCIPYDTYMLTIPF